MNAKLFSDRLHQKYQIDEREHAAAILKLDFPNEFKDIIDCLESFCLKKSAVLTPGGGAGGCPLLLIGIRKACFDAKR